MNKRRAKLRRLPLAPSIVRREADVEAVRRGLQMMEAKGLLRLVAEGASGKVTIEQTPLLEPHLAAFRECQGRQ